LVFDEYTESVANLDNGKEIEARVKRLFNYRKAGIYLALAMFEGGKNQQSAKGLNVSKMSVSKALFHTAKDEGARFLPGGSEAASLDKGEYLLLLPGMAEPERIKAPLFSALDFAQFSKFVAQQAPQDDKTQDAIQDKGLTPEHVRTHMSKHGISQNALAKMAGVSKSDLSRWMTGKNISDDKASVIVAAVERVTNPVKSANVINLQQYRNA
jgi:DNA-binding transcriptional regulator YiaG